ncbi:MAG: creatininase family protein [Ignavibacteria bacterium]
MKIETMNWSDVENYLKINDKCILPVGSTEQHAFLSLSTDNILAEKISVDAADPLNIPVFPVINYGHTPLFMAYPGTVSISIETLSLLLKEILNSISTHGFKKILIVNGHGGNMPLEKFVNDWSDENENVKVKFHNWWRAPKVWEFIQQTDPESSHASWMENFDWTRLKDVKLPDHKKPMVNFELLKNASPKEAREILEEGNYGGYFYKDEKILNELWDIAVGETRELLNEW